MSSVKLLTFAVGVALATAGHAETSSNAATAFGAREGIEQASLSPNGSQIAYLAPTEGMGSVLVVRDVTDGAKPRMIIASNGKPERLKACHWVSEARLVCMIYGTTNFDDRWMPFSRLFAIDVDGRNMKQLSTRQNSFSRGIQLRGGEVVDWLPNDNGVILMQRVYIPDEHVGSIMGSDQNGLGVDRIDTRTTASRLVERPKDNADGYISDGNGTVRVYGLRGADHGGMENGQTSYFFRKPGSRDWERLSQHEDKSGLGFVPVAVDADLNVAYGFKKVQGRAAVYSVALDGSGTEKLLLGRPDVDVDEVVQIGRRNRVIGASYQTDIRNMVFFDAGLEKLAANLRKAVPKQPNISISIIDSSMDERKLLIFAGSDDDSGVYYLFDRDKHDLHILFPARPQLVGLPLANMKAISYRAADGTMIPAYLTFPPGKSDAKGLPAIVMPHGGPADRDEWGFDWLPQFYAARGYVVLQPEFRGSTGYGEAWFQKNGFISWRTAIGDVTDGGHWLVKQGIADPARLAIVGWSYGGYAALQSAVLDPTLFKAVVAIAPVTDLAMLKHESNGWTDSKLIKDFIGTGPHIAAGSPAQNAQQIKVPVLLAHGTMDANVNYGESTFMAARLREAGGNVEMISFSGLDHQLEDSAARAKLLARTDSFIQAAFQK
jgi:dienelactone hydrolase